MKQISLAVILFAVVAALFGAGCVSNSQDDGKVCHLVLCWLKEPGNEIGRQKIIETSSSFSKIPGVLDVKAGKSIPSEREIVDDSFDAAICITFANTNDLSAYLVHPIHTKASKDILLPLVKKIIVYDFMTAGH